LSLKNIQKGVGFGSGRWNQYAFVGKRPFLGGNHVRDLSHETSKAAQVI
jgi:hypothetical protein